MESQHHGHAVFFRRRSHVSLLAVYWAQVSFIITYLLIGAAVQFVFELAWRYEDFVVYPQMWPLVLAGVLLWPLTLVSLLGWVLSLVLRRF